MKPHWLLLAGVVLIGAGIGLSTWAKKHPPEKKAETAEKPVEKPKVKLSPEQLLQAEPGGTEARELELLQAGQKKLEAAVEVDAGMPVVLGALPIRAIAASGTTVIAMVDHDTKRSAQSLVRLDGEAPKLVTSRRAIGAVTVLGEVVVWGEAGGVFAQPATQNEAPRALVRFPNATVTAIAAQGDVVVAALMPRDFDPFSEDPDGAVVALSLTGGAPRTLATKLVRVADVATDGTQAFFVAGYPATLQKVALDGSAPPSELAPRAEGPLLVKDGKVLFKDPSASTPGVSQVAAEGGAVAMVVPGETDRFTLGAKGVVRTFGATLVRSGGGATQSLPGMATALAASDGALWAVVRFDRGSAVLRLTP